MSQIPENSAEMEVKLSKVNDIYKKDAPNTVEDFTTILIEKQQTTFPNHDMTLPYPKEIQETLRSVFPSILQKAKDASSVEDYKQAMSSYLTNVSAKYAQDQITQL